MLGSAERIQGVRDNEVKGDELGELVRVFVERVKYQVLELKKKNKNWSPGNFCAGPVFTGGTSGGERCMDFQQRSGWTAPRPSTRSGHATGGV